MDFGAVMACLDMEECCVLVQVDDIYDQKVPDSVDEENKPMAVLVVHWAGETLVSLEDAVGAFRLESVRDQLTV